MNFDFQEFNRVRLVRGKEAARVRCWDDEGAALLWMSEKDVKANIIDHGPHFGLVRAAQHYGIHPSVAVGWHRETGKPFLVPVEPQRDAMGYWLHPDMQTNEELSDADFTAWLKYLGITTELVWLEGDDAPAAKEVQKRYNEGDLDVLAWEPQAPAGDGWWLGSIHETEDGVVALWLHQLEGAANAGTI